MIRDALVRLVIRNLVNSRFREREGYFGNFSNFGILESSGTQLRKLVIFYSNWCLVELGIKFWKISISEPRDTWRVVVAPRGSCIGICVCMWCCFRRLTFGFWWAPSCWDIPIHLVISFWLIKERKKLRERERSSLSRLGETKRRRRRLWCWINSRTQGSFSYEFRNLMCSSTVIS